MKPKRETNKKYMLYIREKACCVCRAFAPSEPHHFTKRGHGGIGTKCEDTRCLPFCRSCHGLIHSVGRQSFLTSQFLSEEKMEEMIEVYNKGYTI